MLCYSVQKAKGKKYVHSEHSCVRNMLLPGQRQENEYAKSCALAGNQDAVFFSSVKIPSSCCSLVYVILRDIPRKKLPFLPNEGASPPISCPLSHSS